MNTLLRVVSAIGAIGVFVAPAHAEIPEDDEHHTIDEIIVTATPLERTVEQLAQPTSVLFGDALIRSQASSIGETLADQPGVTATYFGPIASRPVIRGQFGERVRVLTNGLDSLDASALSEDHAVGLDSIFADRIEVVRGPATLLYGSGAAGGLVNIVDSRIHETPAAEGLGGAVSLGADSAVGKRSGAVKIHAGTDLFTVHGDFFRRDTDNIEIPGFAESAILRALEEEEEEGEEHEEEEEEFGRVGNTDSETEGAALAATIHGDFGYVGLSATRYDSNYGIPGHHHHHEEGEEAAEEEEEEEEVVRVDLQQDRYDLRGMVEFGRLVDNVQFRVARSDYRHVELEGEEIGTVFETDGTDLRLEVQHRPFGSLEGAVGAQYKNIDFVAEGDEAYVPLSETEQFGLFLFEELQVGGSWRLQGSARAERQEISARRQDITAASLPGYSDWAYGASIGAIWSVSDAIDLSANLSATERHPNSTELYADGPHIAVQRFERGSVTLGNGLLNKEMSTNVDMTLRGQFERAQFSVTAFQNRIDDYIVAAPTSEVEDDLQVFEYRQTDVDMYGFEAELLIDLFRNGNGHLHSRLSSDFVFAEERGSGAYLPRIPPLRFGAGLHYTRDAFDANVEAIYHDRQTHVASNELPTASYTLVNAEVSRRFVGDSLLVFLKGTNLGNEDARRHSSPLKDIVPLPGRSVHLGLRWDF